MAWGRGRRRELHTRCSHHLRRGCSAHLAGAVGSPVDFTHLRRFLLDLLSVALFKTTLRLLLPLQVLTLNCASRRLRVLCSVLWHGELFAFVCRSIYDPLPIFGTVLLVYYCGCWSLIHLSRTACLNLHQRGK